MKKIKLKISFLTSSLGLLNFDYLLKKKKKKTTYKSPNKESKEIKITKISHIFN